MPCKNCNTLLPKESDYCFKCGEKIIRDRLTLKNLFEKFSETFFNYDNKVLQTFINLFIKPEDVIGSYINGIRKKYVNVISYFGLALTLVGIEYFFVTNFFPDFLDLSAVSAKGTENFSNHLLNVFQEKQSLFLIMLIPFYALVTKMVFFNFKKYNYIELLVTFLYIVAHLSIITAFISIISAMLHLKISDLSQLLNIIKISYCAYTLKKLYQLNLKQILIKTLLSLAIIISLFFFLVFAFAAIIHLAKGPDFMDNLIKSY